MAYRNGQPVRLSDVGTAIDSVENDQVAAWYTADGQRDRSIILAIQRQPGTNTVEVADAVKALLPSFREKLPASVNLDILRDSSVPIHESAHDVQFTLLLTLGAGGDGDLPVPAELLGDGHPEPDAADVHRRHVRGHVPARTTAWTTCR